jgi:hypothetical protein
MVDLLVNFVQPGLEILKYVRSQLSTGLIVKTLVENQTDVLKVEFELLEAQNHFQAIELLLRVTSEPALTPPHRLEQAHFLIVTDGPSGGPGLLGQMADVHGFVCGCRHFGTPDMTRS